MSKFCRECRRECKGWCKSFTRTETLLAVLEGVLLLLFLVFLVFLILHLISCRGSAASEPSTTKAYTEPDQTTPNGNTQDTTDTPVVDDRTNADSTPESNHTQPTTRTTNTISGISVRPTKCTAVYPDETSEGQATARSSRCTADYNATEEVHHTASTEPPDADNPEADVSDGDAATEDDKDMVLALVKIQPSGITFGCTLTVVSDRWTVTAASCLDSIEEVDSLDAFVMMHGYGEAVEGRSQAVADVRVHPLYEGGNGSYDLALLRAEGPLGRRPVALPTLVEYFKITIGEKFDILGFGKFRSIDSSGVGRRVRSVAAHALPARLCAGAGAALEARHLRPLAPVAHARCGAAPLCAGVLRARDQPCNYCAGAPLLRRRPGVRQLLGVMGDNEACGIACEPALYVNIARLAAWMRAVMENK